MRTAGFTLIETLIYSAIVAVFLTFSLLMAYQVINASDRLLELRELAENQRFISQKIGWVLNNVSAINNPSLGAAGGILSVNKIGESGNPFIVASSGNQITIASGTAPAVPLTNSWVAASNLNFQHLNFSGKSAIRITADLSNNSSSTTIDATFIVK